MREHAADVEYGVNDRFKFMIEPTLMVFVVLVAARAAALWRAARTLGAKVSTLST